MLERLHFTVAAVCPIVGVSGTQGAVVVTYRAEATQAERTAAAAAVASFDWSQAAQDAWERGREPNLRDLLDDAAARVAAIDTYLAIASPTNAQVTAEFRRAEVAQKRIIQALVRLIQREWRS